MDDPLPATGNAGQLLAASSGLILQIALLIVLVLLSALFSSIETAFTSVNRNRLSALADDGNKRAKSAMALVDRYDKMLYATLIGNNIVNIAASSIATILFIDLFKNNYSVASTVATAVTTVVLLIFGEITPKTLAKIVPEKATMAFCRIVWFFVIIFTPLCWVFTGWKKLLLKIFKVHPDVGSPEEELLTMVDVADKEGALAPEESTLIRSAIEFNDRDVADIFMPRVNLVAIEKNTPLDEIKAIFVENSFSRLPVYEDNIDHIVGMLHEKDFYAALAQGKTSIDSCITQIAYATEHMKISTLLKSLQRQKVHMAVVVDEYGGTLGIVTLEDILEELVGEIWDEHDEVVNYFEKCADNTYTVDGNAEIDDFFELFGIDPDEEEYDANTVSGWVLEKLEDLPKIGDEFTHGRLKISVLEVDHTRVMKIRVELLPEEGDEEKQAD